LKTFLKPISWLGMEKRNVRSKSTHSAIKLNVQHKTRCDTEVPHDGYPAEYRCGKDGETFSATTRLTYTKHGKLAVMVRMRTESSVILFLVPRRNDWLMPTARVPCSNAANIGECKTGTQSEFCTWQNSVRGQETPKMHI